MKNGLLCLNPMAFKNHPAVGYPEQVAEYKRILKIMDEGAWKPMPHKIRLVSDNEYIESDQSSTWQRRFVRMTPAMESHGGR